MLIPIMLGFTSCEEEITNVQIPYVEQIVINCILENGELVDSILITRTLPPLDDFDLEKAIIKDANVTISDGNKTYDLFYKNNYYHSKDLYPESGKVYTINVLWNGKKAYAKTFVPKPVEPQSIQWDIKQVIFENQIYYEITPYILVKPMKNVVFNSGYYFSYQEGYYFASLDNIAREIDVDQNGNCKINFLTTQYFSDRDLEKVKEFYKNYKFVVYAYDEQFYPYFITRFNGNSTDGILGGSSNNIIWNIKGDGIGLFVGRSTTFLEIK